MKKTIIISALAIASLGLSSCDDFLNENRFPLDKQTDNPSYWNNEANVQKQCDYLYLNFAGYASSEFYFATRSDNNASGTGGGFVDWINTNVPSASASWSAPYEVIRQCNYIITKVPGSTLTESQKGKYIGIARLIRAQQYYWLVRAYGDVQYTDEVIDPANEEALMSPRVDRDVVMDKVYDDLDFACKNIGNGSKTTWSSDLAYAMTAEICLYEGTYCKYRTLADNGKAPDEARANKFLGYAATAAKAVMDKNYSLNSTYIGNYNSVSLENNPEMIFYKEYKIALLTHSQINYIVQTTMIAGMSKDAFDSYLFKDGLPLSKTSCNKNDAGFVKKGIIDGVGATATIGDELYIGDLLAERDQRLYQTIDTCLGYGSTPTPQKPDAGMTWARVGSARLFSSSGYLTRKFDNPEDIDWQYRQSGNYTCAPQYWLSYVYCMYAEAKAELGTLTDEDLDISINKLYARADLPAQTVASLSAINDTANDMGVSSLIWEIRRCRRCELMFDRDFRYWDLVRWHQLDRLDNVKNPDIRLGANIKNGNAPYAYMSGDYMLATPNNNRIYDARQYLYPVPQNQINLTFGAVTQNPPWK